MESIIFDQPNHAKYYDPVIAPAGSITECYAPVKWYTSMIQEHTKNTKHVWTLDTNMIIYHTNNIKVSILSIIVISNVTFIMLPFIYSSFSNLFFAFPCQIVSSRHYAPAQNIQFYIFLFQDFEREHND